MSIYEHFGLEPIINASGAVTRLGGAPMPPEVLRAMHDASLQTVPLERLQAAASKRIAALTGTEAAVVTAGCAAALTLGAAAILAGKDPARMEQLPHAGGFANEFLIAREQRSGYDHAVRAAGARLIEVGFNEIVANAGVRRTEAWEYEAAFTDRTAGVLYVYFPGSQPPLAEVVARAHARSLPVLVDAAGEVPPRSNLKDIAAIGADLVALSGGKGIRGPQSTGILCGRRDLVSSAALQMLDMDDHFDLWDPPAEFIDKHKLAGMPRHGIGRGMKVSKEQIVGLVTAVELFASGAYDRDLATFRADLETIAGTLSSEPSPPGRGQGKGRLATCHLVDPGDGESAPVLEIHLDERALGRTAFDVCRQLRNGSPPIYPGHGKLAEGTLIINPFCLRPGDAATIARRIRELLG